MAENTCEKSGGENVEMRELKMRKSRAKAVFTRYKNQLQRALMDDEPTIEDVKDLSRKLEVANDNVMEVLSCLMSAFNKNGDDAGADSVILEMDQQEHAFNEVTTQVSSFNNQRTKSAPELSSKFVLQDFWKHLKPVSIQTFSGNKNNYPSWKASFMACIDSAPASKEYKFLQMKQYLSGEALSTVDKLGHSEVAYDAALERLERKYGGTRRQIAHYIEEIEKFEAMKTENAAAIEKFADLLDIAVTNLMEHRAEDLKDGSFYITLKRKLPRSMIVRYQRWIFENEIEESVQALRTWVLQESEFHTIAAETIHGLEDKRASKSNYSNTPRSHFTNSKEGKPTRSCSLCKGDHGIWNCSEFKSMSTQKRWDVAKHLHLCFRCLDKGHAGETCQRTRECGIGGCRKSHNRMLHHTKIVKSHENAEGQPSAGTFTSVSNTPGKHVALRTVPVIVKHGNRQLQINALLDDGSTKTYVNEDIAFELGIELNLTEVSVNVLNGKQETFRTMPVTLGLESLNGHVRINVDASTTKNVTGNLKAINWNVEGETYEHLVGIRFPFLNNRNRVDMLIGSDYADLHVALHEIKGKPGQPVARLTPLGWTCVGPYEKAACRNDETFFVFGQSHNDNDIRQFWEIESSGTIDTHQSTLSETEIKIVKQTESTLSYQDGHYSVGLPWKKSCEKVELPNNYKMAEQRLKNTEKKLQKDPIIFNEYKKVIDSYNEKGYITTVPLEKQDESGWYLPHFPVIRLDKSTTKVRVVFDASAKSDGVSLNDVIEQGPKLQRELFDVLLRFRKYEIGIICDIQEMYLRVGIIESDRKFHRFLWRNDPETTPSVYEFNRVVFGVNASPYLAQFVSQKHARDNIDLYPMAAETVLKSTYMDDSMDSVPTEQKAIELYTQLSELWSKAGMIARKWLSNSATVLECVPKQNRLNETDLSDGLPGVKTLGIMWQAEEDVFTFNVNVLPEDLILTKRTYLGKISSLFDPLGFLAPILIRAKIIMQDIWISGIEWDDKLCEAENSKAKQWFSELGQISLIKVPRNLKFSANCENTTLHVFTDASCQAFGTVVYVRHCDNQEIFVRQIAAKSKVAPLTSVSIPRLELMGAILGLRVAMTICAALDIDMGKVTFWCDSTNVLWWVRGQSRRFKPFVANRVGEIHEKTNPQQWRYVPTKENPADIVSRGSSVSDLASNKLWWYGPDYLKHSPDNWPSNLVDFDPGMEVEMKKSQNMTGTTMFVNLAKDGPFLHIDKESRLNPDRYSNWTKLVRVYAWVYRFVANTLSKKNNRVCGELTTSEIADAETVLIKIAQQDSFEEEVKNLARGKPISKNSKLVSLNPVIDKEGVMRSNGRLRYAHFLSYDVKNPIILPRHHPVTRLIVKNYHEEGFHATGTNHTLANLSSKFWILRGREVVRECENQCMVCRLKRASPKPQIMAPLPEDRLNGTLRAFDKVAVDYAGPFITIQGRGKKRQKRYMCLFTCLLSRAVHLELSFGLDTNSFLNAFYRMVNRRGLPTTVYSDNGTNFVGANRELRELVELLDKDRIESSVANKGIKWHFNPPSAPHFGGVHETMIKSAKRALKAILTDADVTDEELLTALTGAESLLNSRPLTYQSANPSDLTPLTPNHFLFGQVGGMFAPESVDKTDFHPSKRWRRVQELVRHFWKRWMKEWLPGLTPRKKWFFTRRDLQPNDVVLVVSQDTPRGKWPLGLIVDVTKGKDGHVRVAHVRVGKNVLTRPITKLCPLELDRE